MNNFASLYQEIQLREKTDLTARILHVLASLTGIFRRRLPTHEITPDEFMKVLGPGSALSIAEFLEEHDARPTVWGVLPPNMIPDAMTLRADRIIEQRFSFQGTDFFFHDKVDWHHSLHVNKAWPAGHWSEIPFRQIKELGDIKTCWEMNRHQFFVTLALAYLKTDNVKYYAALRQFLHGWCDQNTPESGVNYISNLEIGTRCLSWIYTDRLLRNSTVYDDETKERLHRNIYTQARHLAEYLPYTEKTARNIHLIGSAAALALVALSYPEWQDSARWLNRALEALWSTFDEQVHPDGLHFEASPGYHLQATEFMLMLFARMRRERRPIPAKAYTLLEKMATALRLIRLPDGSLPNINDNDDSFAFPLEIPVSERIQGVLAAMAVLYERPDFKAAAGPEFPLYARLLLGDSSAMDYRLIPEYTEDFQPLTAFHDSRIFVIRDENNYALLKNNPDTFPQSVHNHADLLHILLYIDGKPVLVDGGTYRYNDGSGYRNALRGTAAHNTLMVDKKNQAEPRHNFGWHSLTRAGSSETQQGPDFVLIDAEHDSYDNMDITHRRILVYFRPHKVWAVIDRLEGSDTHLFEQFWHFPPEARIQDLENDAFRVLDKKDNLLAHFHFSLGGTRDHFDILFGSERNRSCFFSSRYGEIESAPALRHDWTETLDKTHPMHRLTLIGKDAPQIKIHEEEHGLIRIAEWLIDLREKPVKISRS